MCSLLIKYSLYLTVFSQNDHQVAAITVIGVSNSDGTHSYIHATLMNGLLMSSVVDLLFSVSGCGLGHSLTVALEV